MNIYSGTYTFWTIQQSHEDYEDDEGNKGWNNFNFEIILYLAGDKDPSARVMSKLARHILCKVGSYGLPSEKAGLTALNLVRKYNEDDKLTFRLVKVESSLTITPIEESVNE